jgi:hypothetical protein
MPEFSTPTPIDLALNVQVGAITVIASDRDDTVVTVTPTDPTKPVDRRGAEQTTVSLEGTRLTVTGPKPRIAVFGPTESIDVVIALPSGSRLTAEVAVGELTATGRLGATRVKCSMGAVDLDTTEDLWVRAGHGSVSVTRIDGAAEITADHGQIRLGDVAADAVLKASHGSVSVEAAGGDLDARLSYGELVVGSALASVTAKSSYGGIVLGEVSTGSIAADSSFGAISIGVREGVPVWLDLASKEGRVRNELETDGAQPAPGEPSVAVRARTQFGTITIRRAR